MIYLYVCLIVQNYFHLHSGLHFMAGTIDLNYYTSPDIPGWVFLTASIVMGFIGPIGVISNLYVIVGYLRNKTVSATRVQNFDRYRILSFWEFLYDYTYLLSRNNIPSVILIWIDVEIIVSLTFLRFQWMRRIRRKTCNKSIDGCQRYQSNH